MEVFYWCFVMWDMAIRDSRYGGYKKWYYCDVDGLFIVYDEERGACFIYCELRKEVK